MTCDVSISGYDGEPASAWHQHVLPARHALTCDECKRPIAVGQRYERSSGKFGEPGDGEYGGKWMVWRSCLPCAEIAVEFSDAGRCFGVLWDELIGNWEEGAHLQACLNRLTSAEAKRHMRDLWLEWKGL